jgi:hypothetical protein
MKMFSPSRTGILLLLLLSVVISCKKHKIERKYTGDFLFTVNSNTWQMSSGTHHSDFDYAGKIVISSETPNGMSEDDVYIRIYYKSTSYEVAKIDKNGEFNFPTGGGGKFSGEDELDFVYSRRQLSSSVDDTVHGVKR